MFIEQYNNSEYNPAIQGTNIFIGNQRTAVI